MSGVVEGEVTVVIFLGGSFGVDLKEESFNVERTLFPGSKVQGEVSVVVGQGRGFRVSFQEGL